ncbi:hypothetical protein CTI14_47370, partial [Methylobacterium radiotolerans]
MLLLFTIGVEFSLERLVRIARLIFLGGGLQTGLTVAAVSAALLAFGVGWQSAVFTGCLVALSSTAIGFLLAGVLVGPGALGPIRDPALINSASEIGVMLLLFTIGVEFSLERLVR